MVCYVFLYYCSRWKHCEQWHVDVFSSVPQITSGERNINISLSDENYEYMSGHIIDGKNLLSGTGHIFLMWETISMLRGQHYRNVPIVFENVKFLRATRLSRQRDIELTLMIQKGKFYFFNYVLKFCAMGICNRKYI